MCQDVIFLVIVELVFLFFFFYWVKRASWEDVVSLIVPKRVCEVSVFWFHVRIVVSREPLRI